MRMWDSYEYRKRDLASIFATQSFLTMSAFSKDLTMDLMLRAFGVIEDKD